MTSSASNSDTPSWLPTVARIGYGAKGVVYFTIGTVAIMAAVGDGEKILGSQGTLQVFAQQPFGKIVLTLIGIGLFAYGSYRLLCSFVDAEGEGSDSHGLAKRIGYFGSGAAYLALSLVAFTGLMGSSTGGGSSGNDSKEEMTASIIAMPGGRWIIAAVALGILVAAGFQFRNAIKNRYREKFSLDGLAASKRHWIERLAKLGLSARGVVFSIIGLFLLIAAINSDPSKVKGIGEALQKISQQSYGTILLLITAVGLACYGVYCWVLTIYGNFGRAKAGA